jgi:hypothetical protein
MSNTGRNIPKMRGSGSERHDSAGTWNRSGNLVPCLATLRTVRQRPNHWTIRIEAPDSQIAPNTKGQGKAVCASVADGIVVGAKELQITATVVA